MSRDPFPHIQFPVADYVRGETGEAARGMRAVLDESARRQRWHHIEQLLIAVLTAAAITLVAVTNADISRWGYVCGLAASPFWLAATWRARQWGIFPLSIYSALMWAVGIYTRFF